MISNKMLMVNDSSQFITLPFTVFKFSVASKIMYIIFSVAAVVCPAF
jgi:hypothetical protein